MSKTTTSNAASKLGTSAPIPRPHIRLKGDRANRSDQSVETMLEVRDVSKSYKRGKLVVPVLSNVSFRIQHGEFASLVGQSGSGKSTLLNLMGLLDKPDSGEIHLEGKRIDNLGSRATDRIRNSQLGLIFQFYHLLPELTMLENVLVPTMIQQGVIRYWLNRKKHQERAKSLLEMVGLSHRIHHRPRELSGGEMQRTAIARSLMVSPKLLLADEPTGNLDSKNGQEILKILRQLNEEEGVTILMVTHDQQIAKQADSMIRLVEGKVEYTRQK